MTVHQRGVLAICHVSAAERAARAVRGALPALADTPLDLLCYGRASEEFAPPPGARLVAPPIGERSFSLRTATALLVALRRRRYDVVALSQPALGSSRARGLLLAFSFSVGGHRTLVLDPTAGRIRRRVTASLAAVDLLRWITFELSGRALAGLAAPVLEWLAERPPQSISSPTSIHGWRGSVIYLRTDLDLAGRPLRAGGSVAHTEGVLQALQDRGYEVSFWTTGEVDGVPPGITQSVLPALLRGNLPTEIAELLSGIRQGLTRATVASPTGFVYQRYSLNNFAGVALSRRWGVPLMLEANCSEAKWRQDFSVLRFPRLAYACERLILRNANLISAVSRNAAADIVSSGAPTERVRVVPNGVSVSRFAHAHPQELPFDSGKFVVCFVGLFYPWHGVRFLAEAFVRFHRHHADSRLVLVGDGEEASAVRSLLDRNGAMEAAYFAGMVRRAQAPRFMAAADVLVSPHAKVHRFIGSPIKVFEYMASGKPIIATRVAQLEEILSDGETALLVPPEDPVAMADALKRLYDDRELGQRLGANARAVAGAEHSWEARMAALLDGSPAE
jgi:glycosyltransferase involved in cell wall biosynthesis